MTITLITDRVSWSDGFGKRTRNDGIKFWPERAIGRDPTVNAAEVTAALERQHWGLKLKRSLVVDDLLIAE